MVNQLILMLLVSCVLVQRASAQDSPPKYLIALESQYLVGGETNASYDFLIGGKGIFFLKNNKHFDIFLSSGFATDAFNADSRLVSGEFQIGSFWNYQKKFSLFASLGGSFLHESHSILLTEGRQDWQNSIVGVTANIGTHLRLHHALAFQLFFKQTNLDLSSVGAGLIHSF